MAAVQSKMIHENDVQRKYFHVTFFLDCGDIFYKAIRDIAVGEELLVYYGDDYASNLGINATQFSQGPFHKYEERYMVEADEGSEFKCIEKED